MVASVNSPTAVVVSGADDALAELLADLTARGVDAREINVDFASHSPQIEPYRERLLAGWQTVRRWAAGCRSCPR